MKAIGLLIFLGVALAIGGCYYDTQEKLYGVTAVQAPCTDTANVTYSGTIATIIAINCGSCHSGTAVNGGGIATDSYSGLAAQADNGKLMGDINHLPGFNAMPQNANMLDACTIAKIQHWIDMGKPNN